MKNLLGIILLVIAGSANAGLMCADRYTDNTVPSDACEIGSTNNDSEAQVNLDLMFGFDDWTYAWRDEDGEPLPAGLLEFNMDGDLLGGDFTINWASPPQGQVMFVLKDGNGSPDTYVGWLLDPGTFGPQMYDFTSPFVVSELVISPAIPRLKEISHATFYYRDGGPTTQCVDCEPNNVPVPASMPLFGLGLAGLIWARRRNEVRL